MKIYVEEDEFGECEFKWIKKKNDLQNYESFVYDGISYSLYDCVYMYKQGEPECYIGKLVRIWEDVDKSKKIEVQWFFRPSEISYYLKDVNVMDNELFLASGVGIGLVNVNPLEAIVGKCNVICTSTDSRNRIPSPEELTMADYVFYRTFDVETFMVSDQIGETVGRLQVEFVFNTKQSYCTPIPKLDLTCEDDERNIVDVDEHHNHIMEKQGADKCIKSQKKISLGERNELLSNKKLAFGGKCHLTVDGSSGKDETMGTLEKQSIADSKMFGGKVSCGKEMGRFMKLPDDKHKHKQLLGKESWNSALVLNDLEDTPTKGVKCDDKSASFTDPIGKDVQSFIVAQDVAQDDATPSHHIMSSNAKEDGELVKNCFGQVKYVESVEHIALHDGKQSKSCVTNLKGKSRSRDVEGMVGLESISRLPENSTDVVYPKNVKRAKTLSSGKERPSTTDVVSRNETSGDTSNKNYEGPREVEKSSKGRRSFNGRSLKTKGLNNEENLSARYANGHEEDNVKSIKFSSFVDATSSEKAKAEDTIEISEVNDCDIGKLENVRASGKEELRLSNISNKPRNGFSNKYYDENVGMHSSDDRMLLKTSAHNCERNLNVGHATAHKEDNVKSTNNSIVEASSSQKTKCEKPIKKSKVNDSDIGKLRKAGASDQAESRQTNISNEPDKGPHGEYYDENMGLLSHGKFSKSIVAATKGIEDKAKRKICEVTRRPLFKQCSWLREWSRESTWDENFKIAHEQGKLVLLQNLDPAYTSEEVEDIIWSVFGKDVTARMVQHTAISSPHFGQAFVIFKSKKDAESVVQQLDDGCLMLQNQRPLIGSIAVLSEFPGKCKKFLGHLTIDKVKRQRQQREAKSTPHPAQPDNIEGVMALEWYLHQARSVIWWEKLYEEQEQQLKELFADLKSE